MNSKIIITFGSSTAKQCKIFVSKPSSECCQSLSNSGESRLENVESREPRVGLILTFEAISQITTLFWSLISDEVEANNALNTHNTQHYQQSLCYYFFHFYYIFSEISHTYSCDDNIISKFTKEYQIISKSIRVQTIRIESKTIANVSKALHCNYLVNDNFES